MFLLVLFITMPLDAQFLQVSGNDRYLVTQDGDPFFWLGDTAWLLIHILNREEQDKYLADRSAKGFTVIQAVAQYSLIPLPEYIKAAIQPDGEFALLVVAAQYIGTHHGTQGQCNNTGDKDRTGQSQRKLTEQRAWTIARQPGICCRWAAHAFPEGTWQTRSISCR